MPPVDPTQDPDFMKAAPHEQMAYLSQTDPDFAKAPPQEQLGYLMHVRGLGPLSSPGAAKPMQMEPNQTMQGLQSALQTHGGAAAQGTADTRTYQEYPKASLAAGVGGLTLGAGVEAGAAGTAMSMLKSGAVGAVKALPYVAAGEAINYARSHLPGGKLIPPGAELIPMFMAGGSKAPLGNTPAEAEAALQQRMASRAEGQSAEELYQIQNIPAGKTAQAVGPAYPGRINVPMEAPSGGGSSTIDLHGYEPASNTMKVQFKNGNVYEVRGVPPEIYNNYRNAESQGSYYQQNIKGRYDTRLVGRIGKQAAGAKVTQALGGQQ